MYCPICGSKLEFDVGATSNSTSAEYYCWVCPEGHRFQYIDYKEVK